MYKLNTFAMFGTLFLFSVLLGNGMYSNNISTYAQKNQTNTENEAEVEADIEQENKCKKDTECENENEINNRLDITTIITQNTTQTGEPEPKCEDCFSILSQTTLENVVFQFDFIVESDTQVDQNINTLEDLCDFLESTTTYENEYGALEVSLSTNSVDEDQINSILQCLVDLGLIIPSG